MGIDVGGTFTDLFSWDPDAPVGDQVRQAKVLSTPSDPSVGFMDALDKAGIDPADIETVIHGTTIATNALIERSYPEPAMITTDGFRDVIEIGRQRRKELYAPYQTKSPPFISRSRRFGVTERLGAQGETVTPLDRDQARRIVEQIAEMDIKNIAIAFINSYRDGRHELEMAEIVSEVIPDAMVALSHQTRPKMRELGRFTTTAVRAALLPTVASYLGSLEDKLAERGSTAPLYVVKSNGGMMRAKTAAGRPEELLESGPAGGIAAGGFLSDLRDDDNLIITDVGGTSFEASLMEEGQGLVVDEYEVEWERPIITPMLDIRSIGAGGGSIAWIDDGGSLRVGPQSAGADPGPACYGRGGKEPTLTDANLVLGRIDPTLGGKFDLDAEASEQAIATVADRLGLSVLDCAEGIIEIASENMASAIRMVSTDRGRDPRDHTLVAFGGAGGLQAHQIAQSVGITDVLVPNFSGVASAFGATTMDIRHDLESTFYANADELDLDALNAAYEDLEGQVSDLLARDGVSLEDSDLERTALMRYVGQSYDVAASVPAGKLDAAAIEKVKANFNEAHQREYGVSSDTFDIAIVTLRITGVGHAGQSPDDAAAALRADAAEREGSNGDASQSLKGTREAYFGGQTYSVDVHDVSLLAAHQTISGPALIEQSDGIIVLPPGSTGSVDQYENVLITSEEVAA
ncbi:MAG: hydantoinase/oxoprolinase family protein [Actinomycetota bacterium]|nr:hydantoinase/oxoprolinase family protein [Actinomycetota bacterium]